MIEPTPLIVTGSAPERAPLHEQSRLRAAASHATRVLPGPIGELVARELRSCAEFGYTLPPDALLARVAAEILARPAHT